MLESMVLKIGDTVSWKGSWGMDRPKLAKVTSIDLVKHGDKEGERVPQALWAKTITDEITVTLNNGHWAYGSQISPVSI